MEMDERHRKILHDHRHFLIRNLLPMKLLPYLNTVLDESDLREIGQEPTVEKKVVNLLDMLPKRGPDAFDAFIKALEEEQNFIAHYLKPETDFQPASSRSQRKFQQSSDGSCSRCVELEEELFFVTSGRDSIREKKQNLDKEVVEMSKRIKGMSEAHNQEIRIVRNDLQIAQQTEQQVVKESKKQVQAIKDLQMENGKLKEMISEKITQIGEITELLATGQAALKKISETLGETKQTLSCEKEKLKEDTGKLEAGTKEEEEPMEQREMLQSENDNQDTYTKEERQQQWITLRRGSTVTLRHARKYDTDDGP